MKEFIIDKTKSGTRLDRFLSMVMPNIGQGGIYKALRKKKVRINGKHEDGAFRLSAGDTVCIYMNDEFFAPADSDYSWKSASSVISVVYEDENILIADKPSGMPSQDGDGGCDSLESRIRSYLFRKGEVDLNAVPLFIPSLCHRLDRNTSGLVIAAKNAAALRIMNQKIKNREIKKLYICTTERTPVPQSGKVSGWLVRDGKARKMLFYDTKPNGDAMRCETLYRTLRPGSPCVVEAELLTGRTHQIRAAMAHLNCPLVGDVKYGAVPNGKKTYQSLIAYKIIFNFKAPSGELDYLNHKEFKLNPKSKDCVHL